MSRRYYSVNKGKKKRINNIICKVCSVMLFCIFFFNNKITYLTIKRRRRMLVVLIDDDDNLLVIHSRQPAEASSICMCIPNTISTFVLPCKSISRIALLLHIFSQ